MRNSIIKIKPCKCGCGKNQTFNCGGYYYDHMPETMKAKKGKKRNLQKKKKSAAVYAGNKLMKEKKLAAGESEQELWYLMQMNSNERVCDNCGLSLAHYNDWAWRGSQHHIIDKSPTNGCPSIACHPLNNLVLGYYCCHGQWHTSYMNSAKMPVFEKAKEKFLLFKSAIIESELKKLPTCFYELL